MHPSVSQSLPCRAAFALAVAALLVAAGCSSPTSLDPIKADPGIAASLRVIESKTASLFDELERNPSAPFSQYDGIHYGPMLGELTNAYKLARLHDRNRAELQAFADLQQSLEQMRNEHRESRLAPKSLHDFRERINRQIDALLRIERS